MRSFTLIALVILATACSDELSPSETAICDGAYILGYEDGSECLQEDSLDGAPAGARACYRDGYDWATYLYDCDG